MKVNPVFKKCQSLFAASVIFIIISGCLQENSPDKNVDTAETQITDTLPTYTIPKLDSLFIVSFLQGDSGIADLAPGLFEFYIKRQYECAWFNEFGLTEQSGKIVNLVSDYIQSGIVDSSILIPGVVELLDTVSDESFSPVGNDTLILKSDILFTAQFLRFSEKAWKGLKEEKIKQLDWFLPVNKPSQVDYLNTILSPAAKIIPGTEPVTQQFLRLKEKLKLYAEIEKAGGWDTIPQIIQPVKIGDEADVIIAVRKRLLTTRDFSGDSTNTVFDSLLALTIVAVRESYGLSADTVIDKQLVNELNVSVHQRIRKMLINLERWKWIPADPGSNFIAVNIPEYMLHVFENGKIIKDMKVIVGKVASQTVIFSGDLKHVVLSPYWIIPRSIITKETLPALKKNSGYLSQHNMEIVTNTSPPKVIPVSKIDFKNYSGKNFPYLIRQKPGATNSLGQVKFLFPNSYSIYLHDTPSRSLFGETARSFSHGCIRLAEPDWLAQYLLRNDTAWSDSKIVEAMQSGMETFVTLQKPIPVYITYFTSWVDKNGRLNFRKDIYGHDIRLEKELFE